MYYSETFFKKDIYNITESDIFTFFDNSPEESSILELKSGDNLKIEKIYEEVCALHNTQGGLILIGSPRPRKEDGREYFDGELTRSPFRNKDWVYQKISSNITPAPSGLRVHDVKMSDGKYIQIIDIPKSLSPPHQCLNNGVYYLRFETESRFAPHGFVEAMFNKRQEPVLQCSLNKITISENNTGCRIVLNITNKSNIPIIGLHYIIYFENVNLVKGYEKKFDNNYELDPIQNPHNDLLTFYEKSSYSDEIYVRGIISPISYTVRFGKEPFQIRFYAWNSSMNLTTFSFIISPEDNTSSKLILENDTIEDNIKAIYNICENFEEQGIPYDKKGYEKLITKLKTPPKYN